MSTPVSECIRFEPFEAADAPSLAALLAASSITRKPTTNASTPKRCLASARRRIDWHNACFEQKGYRVRVLRAGGLAPRPGA